MCTVHCTLYSIQYIAYNIHCTLYSVQYTMYSVYCMLYIEQCILYTVHCTLYIIDMYICIMYNAHVPIYAMLITNIIYKSYPVLRKPLNTSIAGVLCLDLQSK